MLSAAYKIDMNARKTVPMRAASLQVHSYEPYNLIQDNNTFLGSALTKLTEWNKKKWKQNNIVATKVEMTDGNDRC